MRDEWAKGKHRNEFSSGDVGDLQGRRFVSRVRWEAIIPQIVSASYKRGRIERRFAHLSSP